MKVGDANSDIIELLIFGVAQGSVLGPRFFNIYTRPVYKYLEPTKFNIDGFADDNQLIKRFLPSLQGHALGEDIQYCLNCVSQWMNEYFLRLNQGKTKILVIAPPSVKMEIRIGGVFLNDTCIRFVDSAKDLGVMLDTKLTFDKVQPDKENSEVLFYCDTKVGIYQAFPIINTTEITCMHKNFLTT